MRHASMYTYVYARRIRLSYVMHHTYIYIYAYTYVHVYIYIYIYIYMVADHRLHLAVGPAAHGARVGRRAHLSFLGRPPVFEKIPP